MVESLAAVSFSDPLMLVGLLAAGVPIVLHLLNRIRSPIVMFPTLRFLKITAQKTSRRRQLQNWLLLLLRMAVFGLAAMAIARPLIRGGSSTLAYGFIVMMLVGLMLLVLAGVWGGAAIDRMKSVPAQTELSKAKEEMQRERVKGAVEGGPKSARRYGAMAVMAGLLSILMGGYAAFGLMSNRYFSGDSGEFSGSSTAAVIVLDNSHSMLARQDSASRWQRAKEQVRRILVETIRPAEAVVLATNTGTVPAPDGLSSNTTAILGYVDKLETSGRARAMKERVRTGLKMLEGTQQMGKMLIVVSDFAKPAFSDAELFAAIKEVAGAKDVQIVLMPIGGGTTPVDVGIAAFGLGQGSGSPVVGSEVMFEATLVNNSDAADVKDVELLMDGVVVEGAEARVQLGAGGSGAARSTVKIPHRLKVAGYHEYTLRVKGAQDAMGWDDRRSLVLNVAEQVKVLVLGAEAKPKARSAAFYLRAALAPFEGLPAEGGAVPWSIKPTYRAADTVTDVGGLAGYSAVFMADVPRVSGALAEALAKYVRGGGRLVWVLGPSVDGANYNAVAGPKELLPAALDVPVVTAAGATIDWVDLNADVFAGLFDNQEPFRNVVVTGRWGVKNASGMRGRALSKLADAGSGTPVMISQHSLAGTGGETGGDIYTVFTSPSGNWSNLGSTVLLVPMASRMALGDSGRSKVETAFEPGQTMLIAVPTSDKSVVLDVTTPGKQVVNVRAVMSGDVPRWFFDRTYAEGVYTWAASDKKNAGKFVVNAPGEEVELMPADAGALAAEASGVSAKPALVAGNAGELLKMLEKQSEGTTLAPGVLGIVLILLMLEALYANRGRPTAAAVVSVGGGAKGSPGESVLRNAA